MTRDPIKYDGGDNTYAYAGANPVMFVDPDGLDTTVLVTEGPGGPWNVHSAVYIDNGGSPLLYDPGGSYIPHGSGRGSGDTFYEEEANIEEFIKYQQDDGCSKVHKYVFATTVEEER